MKKTQKTIERIEVLNLAFVGAGAAIGWITGMIHVPSFVLGGGVMQANFWLLKKAVRSALAPTHARRNIHAALWLIIKGGFYVFLLSAVFVRYLIDAKSFAAGVPLLLIACMIVGLSGSKKQPDPPCIPG